MKKEKTGFKQVTSIYKSLSQEKRDFIQQKHIEGTKSLSHWLQFFRELEIFDRQRDQLAYFSKKVLVFLFFSGPLIAWLALLADPSRRKYMFERATEGGDFIYIILWFLSILLPCLAGWTVLEKPQRRDRSEKHKTIRIFPFIVFIPLAMITGIPIFDGQLKVFALACVILWFVIFLTLYSFYRQVLVSIDVPDEVRDMIFPFLLTLSKDFPQKTKVFLKLDVAAIMAGDSYIIANNKYPFQRGHEHLIKYRQTWFQIGLKQPNGERILLRIVDTASRKKRVRLNPRGKLKTKTKIKQKRTFLFKKVGREGPLLQKKSQVIQKDAPFELIDLLQRWNSGLRLK